MIIPPVILMIRFFLSFCHFFICLFFLLFFLYYYLLYLPLRSTPWKKSEVKASNACLNISRDGMIDLIPYLFFVVKEEEKQQTKQQSRNIIKRTTKILKKEVKKRYLRDSVVHEPSKEIIGCNLSVSSSFCTFKKSCAYLFDKSKSKKMR